jgi:hypothetical protein
MVLTRVTTGVELKARRFHIRLLHIYQRAVRETRCCPTETDNAEMQAQLRHDGTTLDIYACGQRSHVSGVYQIKVPCCHQRHLELTIPGCPQLHLILIPLEESHFDLHDEQVLQQPQGPGIDCLKKYAIKTIVDLRSLT